MKNYTPEEIRSLISRFEAHKLPKIEWTHEAHLVVAIWYCYHNAFDEALVKVRTLITLHNSSVGTPNTEDEGYHETITKFWLITANAFLTNKKDESPEKLCNDFINSSLSASTYPLTYYSEKSALYRQCEVQLGRT